MGARWAPRLLTPKMKTERLESWQLLLVRHKSEDNGFVYGTATGNGSWVHHYDPELKSQSRDYRHPNSPRRKQFKTQPSRAMHAHGFLAIQKHHSPRVHGQRYDNQQECSTDTYEVERKNQSCVISGFRREVDEICSLLGYSLQSSRKRR